MKKSSLLIGLEPEGFKRNREINRFLRKVERQGAAEIVTFLEFDFLRQKKPLPDDHPLYHSLDTRGANSPRKFERVAAVQDEIKSVLAPALEAMADGDSTGEAVERLVEKFGELEGHPFVYHRNKGGWQRWPTASAGTLRDYYLARLALLFDAGRLSLLAHCQHGFFLGKGVGRPPKYCPRCLPSVKEAINERLRREGYFERVYEMKKREAIAKARQLKAHGLSNVQLLARLKAGGYRVGKTILKREDLWD